ncbi:unnamed protein product [Phaedon cochleariae]|uniref:CHK kinase-like domain-containing protein n=1 Tax=Phaedon cochleariae TaxID=80249 RepID=A0A9P0DRE4_PHACE|nr:unnamed protein product [Phaedon cochleariae]
MMSEIPVEIRECLKKSVAENLDNFHVEIHEGNKKGEGFLGDFIFLSLTNKKTEEILHLAIKQALASGTDVSFKFVSNVFHNELWFYDTIWPAFKKFQDNFPDAKKFSKISRHYAIDARKGAEKLILENLKTQGFRNHNKTDCFEKKHLEYILRNYGQFHALSMAFRKLDPEIFQKITEPLVDNSQGLVDLRFYKRLVNQCCRNVLSSFNRESDIEMYEKFKVYAEKGSDILKETSNYRGKNLALMHGDCWSNNIMFKYDDSDNIEDIRFIDFQFTKLGTVVFDLSYCIYASFSKEILDDLDHYLRVYHQSLSESLRGYKLDPDLLYPYDDFIREWKQYSKFGVIMGILCNSGKNIDLESMPLLTDLIDEEENRENDENTTDSFSFPSEEIARTLVLHAYVNNYL